MIDLSSGANGRPSGVEFWRAAIRRHVVLAEDRRAAPPGSPRCRRCRQSGSCAVRRRAERAFFGALRERWGGGASGLAP